jgi:hypothetical protein
VNVLERLELVKDIDPYNKQLLNDCYEYIYQLEDQVNRLSKQLEDYYELAGTEQKL